MYLSFEPKKNSLRQSADSQINKIQRFQTYGRPCSTITEMGDHILTVLSTLIGLQGRWRPAKAVEGSLIYDILLNQLIFGKLFSYVPHGNFYYYKIPVNSLEMSGEVPSVP